MAKLTAEQLKALPDEMFGLPKTRQYPMPDKEHVIKAIQFFRYCKPKDRKELAKNINRRAKELKMKVKVQPSSLFYKYADKSIIREGAIINEFHIGQLSPIVPLSPSGPNALQDKEEMDKLKKLWDSNISIDEKNDETLKIAEECENVSHELFMNMIMIAECNYMLNKAEPCDTRPIDNMPVSITDTFKARSFNYDHNTLDKIYNSTDTINVNKRISDIHNSGLRAVAIAAVKYSNKYNNSNINTLNVKGIIRPNDKINDVTMQPVPAAKNFPDEKIEFCQSFIRNMNPNICAFGILKKLFERTQLDRFKYELDKSSKILFHAININSNMPNIGYYEYKYADKTYTFIYDNTTELVSLVVLFKSFDIGAPEKIFMVRLNNPNNPEYEKMITAYFLGANIPNPRLNYATIDIPTPTDIKLEASEFNDLIAGVKIDNDGGVSLVFDYLTSWADKLQMVSKHLTDNNKSGNYIAYKNNMAYLFTMISTIIHRYKTEASENEDHKDALATLSKAVAKFRECISIITKQDKSFNFADFFITNGFNSKINIYSARDEDDLTQQILTDYHWIVGL